jgi:nucleotide-binding universal stress UspA family protein
MPGTADWNGNRTLAVGFDGSEPSQLAVRWAAEHAAARNLKLRVIHAWVWPMFTKSLGPVKGVSGSGLRHAAEATLQAGVDLAYEVSGELDVEGVIEAGLPAQVLRDATKDARLLVVGHRGIGGIVGQLAGSVCLDLAGHSPCPLLVARYPHRAGEPVVAAVSAAPNSEAVIADAIRMARALQTSLELVHVDVENGHHHEPHGRHSPLHGQALVDHAVETARELATDVAVSGVLRQGHPISRELVECSANAALLILGAHRREGGPGRTVSALLPRALCNVMISR